jgi:hypothetical protein
MWEPHLAPALPQSGPALPQLAPALPQLAPALPARCRLLLGALHSHTRKPQRV